MSNLILYASETGQAQKLAEQSKALLGEAWGTMALNDSSIESLKNNNVLFIVSTTGDGDAPANGSRFFQSLKQYKNNLANTQYAILALGDREYANFCQFGLDLDREFKQLGAKQYFDLITVDNLDSISLDKWSQQLATCFSVEAKTLKADISPNFSAQLVKRNCVNPNSSSEKLFDLSLSVPEDCVWQAGDIVQISVPSSEQTTSMREYSIANAYREKSSIINLLVRQVIINDSPKELGRGSGYLTEKASIGENIDIRIRKNNTFKLPDTPTPLIFIATGSGLAGVAGLIDEADNRWSQPFNEHQGGHWLIYGERHVKHDRPFADKLEDWCEREVLKRISFCFSRDDTQTYPKYVQDAIIEHSADIKHWILEKHAIVYVCGSKSRLGKAIPELLAKLLENAPLIESRLILDVY